MHGHDKKEVDEEISKWVCLDGAEVQTSILLPAKFFE